MSPYFSSIFSTFLYVKTVDRPLIIQGVINPILSKNDNISIVSNTWKQKVAVEIIYQIERFQTLKIG